jgi:hypothetical protein
MKKIHNRTTAGPMVEVETRAPPRESTTWPWCGPSTSTWPSGPSTSPHAGGCGRLHARSGRDELSRKKDRSARKSRVDQRTRARLPVLPTLTRAVDTERRLAAERLAAVQATRPGCQITAAGQRWRRSVTKNPVAKVWADNLETGRRHDLTQEDHRAFWAWSIVEVLRHKGIRVEELTELSHHSLAQYRLPGTGELIPLLHIAPSKTDAERLLVIDPELADVLTWGHQQRPTPRL